MYIERTIDNTAKLLLHKTEDFIDLECSACFETLQFVLVSIPCELFLAVRFKDALNQIISESITA